VTLPSSPADLQKTYCAGLKGSAIQASKEARRIAANIAKLPEFNKAAEIAQAGPSKHGCGPLALSSERGGADSFPYAIRGLSLTPIKSPHRRNRLTVFHEVRRFSPRRCYCARPHVRGCFVVIRGLGVRWHPALNRAPIMTWALAARSRPTASSRPPEVRLPHSRELSRHRPRRRPLGKSICRQIHRSVTAVTFIGFRF
jgi:hypothetical protein